MLRSPRPGIPRCLLEPAVLLWAGYGATPRAAHGSIAAVIQQRLSATDRMLTRLERLRPLRRSRQFRSTLIDIAGGARSGAELDISRMCRRSGLILPHRQRRRTDRAGKRRWTDAEWDLRDGSVLVLEVGGAFHTEVREWSADLRRARRLTTRTVVRCSAYEVRHEPDEVAADLRALGVPSRVPPRAA